MKALNPGQLRGSVPGSVFFARVSLTRQATLATHFG